MKTQFVIVVVMAVAIMFVIGPTHDFQKWCDMSRSPTRALGTK